MDVHQLDAFVLWGAAVTFLAILAVRISSRAGLPSLLVYLLMGVALGESGVGIPFEDAELAHALGFIALALILGEGGLTTEWRQVRTSMRLGLSLATVGVAISVAIVSVGAHYLLGLPWELAVLLGAVTSPTDAAAVFSVLRVVPLPRRLTGALEAESGLNDAPTVLLVTLASQGDLLQHGILGLLGIVVLELGGGVLLGGVVGAGGSWVMRRVALPASGLYPLAVLSLSVLSYAGASVLHISGFAAVYTAALILGNTELPHRAATRSFAEGLGWLAQIGLFVMLGLLVSPGDIDGVTIWHALVAGFVLTVLARPLSVLASTVWQRMGLPDMAFISWAGLRGAVPIVLATIPLAEGTAGASQLFDIVFVLVVLDTLVTGPTLPWAARRLGVSVAGEVRDLEIESAPLERLAADLLQIRITKRSRMHGVEVGELRLPKGASVTLIVREGQTKVPTDRTVLRRGDDLLVVTPRKVKERTESRLRSVSKSGRLASWLE